MLIVHSETIFQPNPGIISLQIQVTSHDQGFWKLNPLLNYTFNNLADFDSQRAGIEGKSFLNCFQIVAKFNVNLWN